MPENLKQVSPTDTYIKYLRQIGSKVKMIDLFGEITRQQTQKEFLEGGFRTENFAIKELLEPDHIRQVYGELVDRSFKSIRRVGANFSRADAVKMVNGRLSLIIEEDLQRGQFATRIIPHQFWIDMMRDEEVKEGIVQKE